MKRKFIFVLSVITLFACVFCFTGCEEEQAKSAYDIAVENGYELSETEWLESLKGKDGQDGKDGVDGVNGTNGRDGKDNTLSVNDYYEAAKENGYEGDMLDFIKTCLSVELTDDKYNVSKNLLSSVSIVCGFQVTKYNLIGNPFVGYTIDKDNPIITTEYSAGSGIIYELDKESGTAYIITNYHVVYSAGADDPISKDISVYLYGGEIAGQEISAEYVGGAMNYDIAVLKIENSERLKESDVGAAEFADSNEIVVGQKAVAIGNAEGAGISATSGVISVDSENISMTGADEKTTINFRVMRIDCAVNSGNSGGGLFDADGKLIGIVNAKIIQSDVENIAYALPSNVVKFVADNIIDGGGVVKKCLLGVTVVSTESKAVYNEEKGVTEIEEKVTVYEKTDGEESEKVVIEENALVYGKLKSGDVLKEIKIDKGGDGVIDATYEITRSFIIVDAMLTVRVGDKITITAERKTEDGLGTEEVVFTFDMTESCISEVK